jgi:hypothetical protein
MALLYIAHNNGGDPARVGWNRYIQYRFTGTDLWLLWDKRLEILEIGMDLDLLDDLASEEEIHELVRIIWQAKHIKRPHE